MTEYKRSSKKMAPTASFIYAMRLKGDKYYVGRSRNLARRFLDHKTGKGSVWTKLHGVDSIIELYDDNNDFKEVQLTLQYMKKYGVNNVRGGPFCKTELTASEVNFINSIMRSENFMRKEEQEDTSSIDDEEKYSFPYIQPSATPI